jgi:hypothetical protein
VGTGAVKPNAAPICFGAASLEPFSQHLPCGSAARGCGRSAGIRSRVSRTRFWSGRLAPSTANPTGTPGPSTRWLRWTPFWARSLGFGPVFCPPAGRLGHAPVQRQPLPVDALQAVGGEQARLPHLPEDAVLHPALEAVLRRGAGTELGGVPGLALAAGAEHEEEGIPADAVGRRGPAAAEAVAVHAVGEEPGKLLP